MRSNADNGSRAGYSSDLDPRYKELVTSSERLPKVKGGGKKFVEGIAAAKAAGRKR